MDNEAAYRLRGSSFLHKDFLHGTCEKLLAGNGLMMLFFVGSVPIEHHVVLESL